MPRYVLNSRQVAVAQVLARRNLPARRIAELLPSNLQTVRNAVLFRKTRLPSAEDQRWAEYFGEVIDRDEARIAEARSTFDLIMEWCDQSFVTIARHDGWWWVGYRNGKAYKAKKLNRAIDRARHGGP